MIFILEDSNKPETRIIISTEMFLKVHICIKEKINDIIGYLLL